ncbi:putative cysteine protease atg4 [Smittium mucronatum]|uniref:Cysteine protease n=1 Tax=Smittium mucronatum TaxID=133383 RepID=A0A1R0GM03_9FUNG|nr:putative cysteine protease atg4 [Smittium mucronatum]
MSTSKPIYNKSESEIASSEPNGNAQSQDRNIPTGNAISSEENVMRNLFNNIAVDVAYLKSKVVNSVREYYTTTTESLYSILDGRYNGISSDKIWLLGSEYPRIKTNLSGSTTPTINIDGSVISGSGLASEIPESAALSSSLLNLNLQTEVTSGQANDYSNPKTPIVPGNAALINSHEDFLADFQSLIWCTYRQVLKASDDLEFSSDYGWGCMLRAGQSLVAHTLQRHYFDFRIEWENIEKRIRYLKILELFLDDADVSSIFSIYNMARAGKNQGKHAGDWFGPNGTAKIIQSLGSDQRIPINIYTTSDGVVNLSDFVNGDIRESSENSDRISFVNCSMDPTLILIVTRLGIDRINPIYYNLISECLSSPLSVGIAGGKPSSALYFVGKDGDDLIYLDPHYTRPSIQRKNLHDYTESDVESYRCSTPRKVSLSRVDPCMFIGFYVKDICDLEDFCNSIDLIVDSKISGTISISFGTSKSIGEFIHPSDALSYPSGGEHELGDNLGVISGSDDEFI